MLYFQTELDNQVPADVAQALGRLLTDFQYLESMLHDHIPSVVSPMDPLGLFKEKIKNHTTRRKIESLLDLMKQIANKYGIPEEACDDALIVDLAPNDDPERKLAQVFAGTKFHLKSTFKLFDYRNDVFHKKVDLTATGPHFGGDLKIPADATHFNDKRQEVLAALYNLGFALSGLKSAINHLATQGPGTDTF